VRKYVHVAMRPWKTLKGTLLHPKDKPDKEDITECVYKVPCANCDKTYVGETEAAWITATACCTVSAHRAALISRIGTLRAAA